MTRIGSFLALVALGLWGCDDTSPKGMTLDLSFVIHDLAIPVGGGPLDVTGDPTSGLQPTTLSTFTCTTDPSTGEIVSAQFPIANFGAGTTLQPPLIFNITSFAVQLIGGGAAGNIYYQSNGLMNFSASTKSGTINNVAMPAFAPAKGTITANGGWSCP